MRANVGEIGLGAEQKKLERMEIAGTVSYGNYFRMSSPGQYTIEVEIKQPGMSRPVTLNFAYAP